jgi:hypothetical protein
MTIRQPTQAEAAAIEQCESCPACGAGDGRGRLSVELWITWNGQNLTVPVKVVERYGAGSGSRK